ncbi:MAG: RNA recognition motif domain-containing protein [Planctomycetota bacterium]
MRIYVGNLNYRTTEDALEDLFAEYGQVEDVTIATDRETGRPRGFGFVTMPNDGEAREAMEELNGQEVDGRSIVVNEARPRTEARPPRGGQGRSTGGGPRRGGGPGRGRPRR